MKTDRKFRKFSKTPFFASFALTCVLAAGNAGAGIPVTDVGNGAAHWTNSISTYISKIQSFTEYGVEATREVNRIKDLATNASSFVSRLTPNIALDANPRPPDHGMNRCDPDFSGFSMADLFQVLVPSMAASIPEQQRAICKKIVRLENELYNLDVEALKTINRRGDELNQNTDKSSTVGSSGTSDSALRQGVNVLNTLTLDLQKTENLRKRYEGMIKVLEKDMKYLASEALNGKKKGIGESLLATGAQTLALCGGLLVAKSSGSAFNCTP